MKVLRFYHVPVRGQTEVALIGIFPKPSMFGGGGSLFRFYALQTLMSSLFARSCAFIVALEESYTRTRIKNTQHRLCLHGPTKVPTINAVRSGRNP
jgi:hypothetical protein